MSEKNCPRCGALPGVILVHDKTTYLCGTTEDYGGDIQWQSQHCKRHEPMYKRNLELKAEVVTLKETIAGYAASLDDQDKLRRKAEACLASRQAEVERLKGRTMAALEELTRKVILDDRERDLASVPLISVSKLAEIFDLSLLCPGVPELAFKLQAVFETAQKWVEAEKETSDEHG